MTGTPRRRIEGLDAASAASVIETFARAVREAPGVWAVTVREARLEERSVELHLIVHAETDEEGTELLPIKEGWPC